MKSVDGSPPELVENPVIYGNETMAWAALEGLEGLTDGEKFVALFYEVRQARVDFQAHIREDRTNFGEIKTLLEEIKTHRAQVVLASKVMSRVVHGVVYVLGAGGLGAYIWKHWIGA